MSFNKIVIDFILVKEFINIKNIIVKNLSQNPNFTYSEIKKFMMPYVEFLELPYEKCIKKLITVIKYDIFVRKNIELDENVSKQDLEIIYCECLITI